MRKFKIFVFWFKKYIKESRKSDFGDLYPSLIE